MSRSPDFYIDSRGEHESLKEPRAARFIKFLSDSHRGDWVLVQIEPAVIGQTFGLGGRDIEYLVVAPRFTGMQLIPVGVGYVPVNILGVKDNTLLERDTFDSSFESNDVLPISLGVATRHDSRVSTL